jgi:CRISPR-associated protein Csc3
VPPSLNVQLFSVRLEGGSSAEPKRMVCPVCRMQFILEKLAWRAHRDKRGAEQVTYYLHLFPNGFLSEPLIAAWRGGLERLHAEEVDESFFLDTNAYFKSRLEGGAHDGEKIQVTQHKVNGIALPKLSEAIGNVLVLALNAPGDTVDGQFLFALEKTLVLRQFFPCRILVTRSPVPPLLPEDSAALVMDGVPAAMRWLVPEPVLTTEALERLEGRLARLHALRRLLYQRGKNEDPIVELIRAACDDPLALYYAADRMIERKTSGADAERQATWLGRMIAPHLKVLSEQDSPGQWVRQMIGGRQ